MVKASKNIKNIANYEPGLPLEEAKRRLKLRRVYKLASNENPFSPSLKARQAIEKEILNLNRYPDAGCFYLRKKIASLLKIKEGSLIFGNGSDEIITLALRAFVEKGDEVIIGNPTFLIYKIQALACGAKVVVVPHKNYTYDLEAIKRRINRRTKIIFIANPENPLGTYLNFAQVRSFVKDIPSSVLIFFDEAYFEFAPSDFPATLEFIKKGKTNILFTRTFSKAYSLAGLRIGYGVAQEEIISNLEKVREPFNVNRIAQAAALAALKDRAWLKDTINYLKREKEYIYRALENWGIFHLKSATNFVLMRIPLRNAADLLLKQGIIVRDMSAWGLKGFIRVSVGKREENLAFLKALGKIIQR